MVRRGDVVLCTVHTWESSLFSDRATALQQRLQIAGFQVLAIDDGGLSWLGTFGDLLVTVRPLTSDYGQADDIASIVAGAAEAVGYGKAMAYRGDVVETAAVAPPSSTGQMPTYSDPFGTLPPYTYEPNLHAPNAVVSNWQPPQDGDGNRPNPFALSSLSLPLIVLGATLLMVVVARR